MKKLLFVADYYRGDGFQDRNLKALYSLLSPIFIDLEVECNIIQNSMEISSEDLYIQSLIGQGKSLLESYDLSNSSIIGFELSKLDINFLNKKKIPWISFETRPVF